jgi:hypothetical protein
MIAPQGCETDLSLRVCVHLCHGGAQSFGGNVTRSDKNICTLSRRRGLGSFVLWVGAKTIAAFSLTESGFLPPVEQLNRSSRSTGHG